MNVNYAKFQKNVCKRNCQIKMGGQKKEKLHLVSYLGNVIDVQGGALADVKARIGKARQSCIYFTEAYMDPVRSPKKTSLRTKLKLYNSNVKTVLL